jgi:hypothetical protein
MNLNAKCFQNTICKDCIKKQIAKYGEFTVRCTGITVEQDVKYAIENGFEEHDARWMFDATYFFEKVYGKPARWYQRKALLCSSKNIVARQCRQSGKSLAFVYRIMHFVLTNENVSALIITPQEVQIKKLWDEYILRDCLYKTPELKHAISNKSMSPVYIINFENGSKITLMIAGPGVRGQTADWIYIDEAAIVPSEVLADVLAVILSKEDNASILMTSTPKGRGNMFYKGCRDDPEYTEIHVSIYDVKEMAGQIKRFKKLLGETGFMQECEAEFPDLSGGPFNLRGIDLAKVDRRYEDNIREPGYIYFGGVDWNGPAVGTYFYIVGFNPDSGHINVVDKKIVSSASWNSTIAKQAFIDLNRKWIPKHWMADYGYGHTIIEELKRWSMMIAPKVGGIHPDAQIRYTLEAIEFGAFMEIEDPFNREVQRKTTKSFIVGQVSRLFEPINNMVCLNFDKEDEDLVKSLENYKLLNVTAKGVEQYGFDKKDGIEDHNIDSLMLALYGIIKFYGELFRRILMSSATFSTKDILAPNESQKNETKYGSIILLTDNSPEPIYLDERSFIDRSELGPEIIISRTLNRGNIKRPHMISWKRTNSVIRRSID